MIDIKPSFLGLWHQVQTYLSYCQRLTLLSLVCVCPWDTIMCSAQLCDSIGDCYQAQSWQGALSNGCRPPKHTGGASIHSCPRQQWPLTPQCITFIIHGSCSSTFSSLFCVFPTDFQWESCKKCDSLRKKKSRGRKEHSLALFFLIIHYWTEQDCKY